MNSLCVDGRNVVGRELKSIKTIPTHMCEHTQSTYHTRMHVLC